MDERELEKEVAPCRAVSFLARVRSGGGAGKSIQVTIPKDVVDYLGLGNEDFVKVAVHKLDKTSETSE